MTAVCVCVQEIYPPNVADFCYMTDNTLTQEQVILMEGVVLKKLGNELTVPTAKTFLRRLLQVGHASHNASHFGRDSERDDHIDLP